MSIHLVGGGWSEEHLRSVYGPFVEESSAVAGRRSRPTADVGVVQLFDSSVEDGVEKFGQFATIIEQLGDCRAVPFLVAAGEALPRGVIDGVDGLLVAGGPTPAYHAALAPVAAEIRGLVGRGVPYLGFSAGAAIAAHAAVIGGWRHGDLVIAPEESGEELEQLTIVPGLGLVDVAVDVHAAQWGTLARAMTAVRLGAVDEAVAIDEDTVCTVADGSMTIAGAGSVWWVTKAQNGVTVETARRSTIDRGTYQG